MIHKYLLSAALVAAFAMPTAYLVPASAATMKAKAYYAEQSLKTKFCYVVDFKPNPKFATMLGSGSYPSITKAAAEIKATKDCKAPPMKMKPKSK